MKPGLRIFLITALTILIFTLPASITTPASEDIDYVALGDSLAFGVTPDWTKDRIPDSGYAHLLANHMDELGELSSFTNQYSYPGYTTEDVMIDLRQDVRMPSDEVDDRGIRTTVSEADIVTLSAGANDVLDELSIKNGMDQMTYDPQSFERELDAVGRNLKATIAEILSLNPDADIYVMGYYNPLPHLHTEKIKTLNEALDELNLVIHRAAKETKSTFVPTSEAIGNRGKTYLPDPTDIHPNNAGHQVIANKFWEKMSLQQPTDYEDVPGSSFASPSIDYLSSKKIFKGYDREYFSPDQEVTRREAIMILDRSLVLSQEQPTGSTYTDIDESMDAYDSITKWTMEAMVDGTTDGRFRPDDALTRGELAKVLVKGFDMKMTETTGTFTDVPDSYWASPYIETLASYEIITGYEDNRFQPQKAVTRQELALLVERTMQLN
ncbi:S-layer homology domain-containing protein [Salimicrobium sp. PL1-032A]|uniref:S-layer homology domain-containing protein n=1 Tax=Salimicrobium sp. PL1-032A TaxID=3095364 RepID=UPI003260996F